MGGCVVAWAMNHTCKYIRDLQCCRDITECMYSPMCQEGESSGEEEELAEEECETMTVSECMRDDQYDEKVEEDEQMLEKYKQERMDEMFPDEVDTPRDVPARVR